MKNFTKIITILTVTVCLSSTSVYAHSGRTDSSGGHYDKSTGRYHYHGGGSSSSSSSSSNYYNNTFVEDQRLSGLKEDLSTLSTEASDLLGRIDYLEDRYNELVSRHDILKSKGVKIDNVPYQSFNYEKFLLKYEIIDSNFYNIALASYDILNNRVNQAKPVIESYEKQLYKYEETISKLEKEVEEYENSVIVHKEKLEIIKNLQAKYVKVKDNFKMVYNIDIPEYIVDYSKNDDVIINELDGLVSKYENVFNERKEQIIQTEEIGVYFNGTKVNVGAYINNSVVYIELRPLMQLLGYEVKWNNKSGKIEIPISQGTMKLSKGSKKVEYNGYIFEMPGKVEIKNGKTYVPINLFDENIFYDKIHNVILIETFK